MQAPNEKSELFFNDPRISSNFHITVELPPEDIACATRVRQQLANSDCLGDLLAHVGSSQNWQFGSKPRQHRQKHLT